MWKQLLAWCPWIGERGQGSLVRKHGKIIHNNTSEDRAVEGLLEVVVGSCGNFLPFGSTFSGLQWRVKVSEVSHYPSHFAPDLVAPSTTIRTLPFVLWNSLTITSKPSPCQLFNVFFLPTPTLLHSDLHCRGWEIANIFLQAPCQLASFCQQKTVENRRWEEGSSFLLLALMVWWLLAIVVLAVGNGMWTPAAQPRQDILRGSSPRWNEPSKQQGPAYEH